MITSIWVLNSFSDTAAQFVSSDVCTGAPALSLHDAIIRVQRCVPLCSTTIVRSSNQSSLATTFPAGSKLRRTKS